MRQFDLQPPFSSCCAFAKDLKDQARAIDHLALELILVALLHGGQRAIDDDKLGLMQIALGDDVLDLAFAKQRAWARVTNGIGKASAITSPMASASPFASSTRESVSEALGRPDLGADDQGAGAPSYFALCFFTENQASEPSSPSHSPVRSTGPSGWIVDTACL
jgi:hypothetical protein